MRWAKALVRRTGTPAGRFHVARRPSRPFLPFLKRDPAPVAAVAQILEQRVLFSLDPSAREQELLELLNRMRAQPADELPLLLNTGDEAIERALDFFDVDRDVLAEQWALLESAPPVAWNEDLSEAALFHNEQMLAADEQSHQVPGEPSLRERATVAGYTPMSGLGESVFAFTESMIHGHAGFAIDWGLSETGIQQPPGHRNTMMNPMYRDIGISVIDTLPNKDVGPMLVTQDFGAPSDPGDDFLMGVIYDDANADGFYTAGEGIADADLSITALDGIGQVYQTTSMTAGGYQIALPVGVYRLDITSDSFDGVITFDIVGMEDQNLKIDATADMAVTPPDDGDGGDGDGDGDGDGEEEPNGGNDGDGGAGDGGDGDGGDGGDGDEDDGDDDVDVDEQPPIVELAGKFKVVAGRTDAGFRVRVRDVSGLDESSLADASVRLQGPNGVDLDLKPDAVTLANDGTSATLSFGFDAPGGYWDAADSGPYVLTLRDAADNLGNRIDAASIEMVQVSLSPKQTPAVTLAAEPMRRAGKKFHRVQVEYFSRNRIDVGTLGRNDVIVRGSDGERLTVKFIGVNRNGNGKRRVATYRITAPSGQWESADNGRYRVGIRAGAVRDADGNFVPPGKAGSFKVNVPTPSKRKKSPRPKAAFASIAEPAAADLFSNARVRESTWNRLEEDVFYRTTRG